MTKERIIKRFERNGCKIVYTRLTNKILVSHKEFIKVFPSLNKAYQKMCIRDRCGVDNRFQAIETKHHVLTFRIFKEGCRVIFANCNDNDLDKEPCLIAKLDDLPLLFEISEI